MAKQKQLDTRYLTTDTGTNIHKRIQDGRTLLFDNELVAKRKAESMNSYHYQVYEDSRTVAFYAVPR